MSTTPPSEAYTDVVELCAMLQCLGFSVKSLETSDCNMSQDGGTRTVVINCQSSGLHVVLESVDVTCSCPSNSNQNSGFWQVSGVTRGKLLNKEYGSALLGSLPKAHRERLTKELQEMVRCIKENNDSDIDKFKEKDNVSNKSASMIELKTPEKKHLQIKLETPKRYRSLDTLTTEKEATEPLPAPGPLQKQHTADVPDAATDAKNNKTGFSTMCQRQSTYTLSSTSDSFRRNKTSSPIQAPQNSSVLENLIAAERAAEDLKNKLSSVIRDFTEENKNDSSMSSLVLDVSKISVMKGPESSKLQFASSPNLSGLAAAQEDLLNRLKRADSASTSNLAIGKSSLDGKTSRFKRLSPNIFRVKKDSPSMSKLQKLKSEDKNSKLNNLFKPKVTSAQSSKTVQESPNLSATRKKFSHVKSTIPRPATKKD